MREFSPEIQTLLERNTVSGFFLVQWGSGSESFALRHTTFPYDLYITDNYNTPPPYYAATFRANNGLSSVDAPRLADTIDREAYKISYIDNDLYMFNIIRDRLGVYGAACTVWIGLINTTENTLDGYLPGQPLTDYKHLITAYYGAVDTYGISVDVDGAIITTIELASPMAALDIVHPIFTSGEFQKQLYSNDTCFDLLHISAASQTLKWGKL